MEYSNLGNTDIKVSKLCISGMSFGKAFPDFHQWTLNQSETNAMVVHALNL